MIFSSEEDLVSYHKMLPLPSCSMVIYRLDSNGCVIDTGGISLEKQIPGFMTDTVEGRDALDNEISEITYAHVDGARYRSKKQLTRDITINYHLMSYSPEIHRKKLAKLRSLLFGNDYEYCMFRFRDEVDVCEGGGVFYIGTVKALTESKFERNFFSDGTITIHCSDPFKYSYKIFSAKATKVADRKYEFAIDYNGTYPSSPKFIARQGSGSENGYIAYADEKSHIIQIGDPKSTDGQYVKKTSDTVVNEDFGANTVTLKSKGWVNNYFSAPSCGGRSIKVNGKFERYSINFTRTSNSSMPDGSGLWLKETDSCKDEYWHGPSIFKGFYNESKKKAYHLTDAPVKWFHVDMDYAFAKQSNGKENRIGGYEMIIFGVDTAKTASDDFGNCWVPGKSNIYSHPTINNSRRTASPIVRVAFWGTNPNNTTGRVWIYANGVADTDKKLTTTFDYKMPLPLVDKKNLKTGWVEWMPGQWSYYKNGKFLYGWQKLRDTYGTFWFYFGSDGYAVKGVHYLKYGSLPYAHYYFNDRCEMITGTVHTTIDGVEGDYTFGTDGRWVADVYAKGWHGNGYLYRYYEEKDNKLVYVTGWKKIDGKWYYFDSNGYTVHGWQKLKWNGKENIYYFNSSCQMVTGSQAIGGKVYQFNSDGSLNSKYTVNLTNSSKADAKVNTSITDPYYKMGKSTLSVETYNKKLAVKFNGKTYSYSNVIPDTVIFTGIGIQEYVFAACQPITYTQAMINKGTPIGVQYIDKLTVKVLTSDYQDIKNAIPANSSVTVDCNNGDIYLNDEKSPGLGALGNDYETLKLVPKDATQKIQCTYSDWVPDGSDPEFEIQYREVYI